MGKFSKMLSVKVTTNVAAYIILVAIFIAVITLLGIYTFRQYRQDTTVANLGVKEQSEELNELEEDIQNLTSTENIKDVNELQKLNEKELEEAKKKEEKEGKKDSNKEVDSRPQYYIKVNYKAQVVTIYTKDKNGKYTKPVKAMVCSTGTYTPSSGVYKIPYKYRWLCMIGDVYSQYCTQIVGDILFHSVPYLERGNHASLEYWEYDKLGTRASLGCVRLTCIDAKWIYDNCRLGTQVEFYSSSNPGPLGKPSARKISSAPASVRGWDPTDPAKGNPWPNYLKKKDEESKPPKPTETGKTNEIENSGTNTVSDPIPETGANQMNETGTEPITNSEVEYENTELNDTNKVD